MAEVLKLRSVPLTRFNNAEYAYFARQVIVRIDSSGAETLHVPTASYTLYKEHNEHLADVVAQSRASEETPQIVAMNKEEDITIQAIMATIRTQLKSPIAAKREAATALEIALRTFVGSHLLPQRQQLQNVSSILRDLAKEENTEHVVTLGLQDEVALLSQQNSKFQILLEQRTNSQLANPVESAKPIRTEMDKLYNEIMNTVWAFSIATPSEELTSFITYMNKIIDETVAAYNMRISHLASSTEEEQTPAEVKKEASM